MAFAGRARSSRAHVVSGRRLPSSLAAVWHGRARCARSERNDAELLEQLVNGQSRLRVGGKGIPMRVDLTDDSESTLVARALEEFAGSTSRQQWQPMPLRARCWIAHR